MDYTIYCKDWTTAKEGEDLNHWASDWERFGELQKGDRVFVSSSEVSKPVAVRYAWAKYPTCNLYNKEGLPATPFRTDDWPGVTQSKVAP